MKLAISKWTLGILAAALLLSGWALVSSEPERMQDDGAQPAPRKSHRSDAVEAGPSTHSDAHLGERLDQLARARGTASDVNEIFGSESFKPPPPPPPPPPRPRPPPFPYKFMGAMDTGSTRTLFLTSANRVLLVQTDQVIDGTYHVDHIDDARLTVTYLPLKEQQTIVFGTAP